MLVSQVKAVQRGAVSAHQDSGHLLGNQLIYFSVGRYGAGASVVNHVSYWRERRLMAGGVNVGNL